MNDGGAVRADEKGTGMSESDAYDFDLRIVRHDREGYYYPRWDRATPMTIRAATKQEAVNKACAVMGDAPRGWYWGVRVDKVRPAAIEATP